MGWIRLVENQQRVRQALLQGYVDEVVVCNTNCFDKMAGAMYELGYWQSLELVETDLEKDQDDVPNELLFRELAVLPLLRIANPHQAPAFLFQDHGVLRFLGFTIKDIREGFNQKGVKSSAGKERMRPHHRDDLYNALKAVKVKSLEAFRRAHITSLFRHKVVEGGVYAIDGTGISGTDYKLVIMQNLTAQKHFVVNWRVQGPGSELTAGKEMVEEILELAGAGAVSLLLIDGGYVDGAWLAGLKLRGIDGMVRVSEDMAIYQEMLELSRFPEHTFQLHRYTSYEQGKKALREVELALFWGLQEWDSYRESMQKAEGTEGSWPGLWGFLVREWVEEKGKKKQITWGVVSTRELPSRVSGFDQWRGRWVVENNGFRELNQGAWLEKEKWGRSEAAIKAGIYLKIGAHNCYCLLNTRLGERLAVKGLRGLQQKLWRGTPPWIMVVVGGHYGLFTAEELVTLMGVQVKETVGLKSARQPP
jgi:hypothetical protein